MFKFRDDSYIEGQLDLCNTVNDKYPALTEFFDSEKGYDIVDYNRRSTTSIEKVVYEAGDPSDTHTDKSVVANYWRIRGRVKGNEAILHKFHYTNDTGKTGKVYITVYDHFQNNALDYCDWYGDLCGWSSSGSGAAFWYDSDIDVRIRAYRNYGSTTRIETRTREVTDTIPVMTRQKHYVYWFDDDDNNIWDIWNHDSSSSGKEINESSSSSGVIHSSSSNNDNQISSGSGYNSGSSSSGGIYYDPTQNGGYMGGGSVSNNSGNGSWEANEYEGHTLYEDSKGRYYWEEVWTTKTITRTETYPVWITSGDDYFTRDCPDNQVYTFFFCTLNPSDTLDVWLEGEDSDAIPDPASYLKVEITFDGSYVEVSPEVQEKTDGNKIEADGFANDMNFDWGRQEVVSGLVNDMQFGWGADLTGDGTANDMQWRQL